MIKRLEAQARTIRRRIIEMLRDAGSGHAGGSLSGADIGAVLYFHQMKHNPKDPHWADRDRFILCKGHCAPLLYAVLAESGYFPREKLKTLRQLNSSLQGHPNMKKTPGVEASTGSLGQGLSIANGIALAGKLDQKDYTVYALMGDGELGEGQVWEAAMLASHYKLDNVVAILDRNRLQVDGPTETIMALEPLAEKWKAFGWHVVEADGHDIGQLLTAFAETSRVKGKPTLVIAHTIKGKGVSFMENQVGWHGRAPTNEEAVKALAELGEGESL